MRIVAVRFFIFRYQETIMSVITTIAAVPIGKMRFEELQSRFNSCCSSDSYVRNLLMVSVFVTAVTLAYTSNSRSGQNNPVIMAIVASLFPEVYLIQAGVRMVIVNDYFLHHHHVDFHNTYPVRTNCNPATSPVLPSPQRWQGK